MIGHGTSTEGLDLREDWEEPTLVTMPANSAELDVGSADDNVDLNS
jgi:hypothetical protein